MMLAWPHSVKSEVRGSRDNQGMIKAATRESKVGADILRFQIRQLFTHLLWSEAVGEQIQYVLNSNTQATNARTATTLTFERVVMVQQEVRRTRPKPFWPVFVQLDGQPVSGDAVGMAFVRVCRQLGITDFRFHDLRHTFASSLVQRGVDLYRVQRLLGHRDGRMTQRYAHLAPENLRDAVQVFNTDYHKFSTRPGVSAQAVGLSA